MVFVTAVLRSAKGSAKKRKFYDSLRLLVKAGPGGHGLPKYGGIGGDGGDILVEGKAEAKLKEVEKLHPSKRISAEPGENSLKNRIRGAKGSNVKIEIPLGVTLYDEEGRNLGEINTEGDQIIVAKGGQGGSATTGYSGLQGQKFVLTLDLKLIADVGLVGFPNAGKSTLLSVLSKAKPKIASYPFTTIQPNIGTLMYPDLRQISMADLPGLIEGAHANIGMGHRFLKHVERTKLLLLVVDVGGFQLGAKYQKRSCLETLVLLNKELELYKEELLDKPAILVINKMDLPDTRSTFEEVRTAARHLEECFTAVPENMRPTRGLKFMRIFGMSARSQLPEEVETLKNAVREVLDEAAVGEGEEDIEFFKKITREYKRGNPVLI
ncbi:GTP-Hypothetical protein protein [Nesidiocoris tenuis]|uniref:OBG-type G domain-containing protein n=1 Tax=Nesidiocoris tenuis TaxID=355587 RepID=A0ABN7AWD8_9HEMI|nr:GTP-Hypothetical protein protein [Nesidiocoris tenuis]